MSGLERIAKLYGGIVINGQQFVWDYAKEKAVPMPIKKRRQVNGATKEKPEEPTDSGQG